MIYHEQSGNLLCFLKSFLQKCRKVALVSCILDLFILTSVLCDLCSKSHKMFLGHSPSEHLESWYIISAVGTQYILRHSVETHSIMVYLLLSSEVTWSLYVWSELTQAFISILLNNYGLSLINLKKYCFLKGVGSKYK